MDTVLSILSGGAAGALLVWLIREWISERMSSVRPTNVKCQAYTFDTSQHSCKF